MTARGLVGKHGGGRGGGEGATLSVPRRNSLVVTEKMPSKLKDDAKRRLNESKGEV